MVRVIPPYVKPIDTLKEFLVTELSATQLQNFKRAFEKGSNVHLRPMVQSEPAGADDEGDGLWGTDECEVIAEVGEYETTEDRAVCSSMSPIPREAVRLLPSVAKRENLFSEWTLGSYVSRFATPDSCGESLPAGTIRMSAKYDPAFRRVHYQWPEGSL